MIITYPFQDFGIFCSMKYFVGGVGDPQNYPHNTSHLYTIFQKLISTINTKCWCDTEWHQTCWIVRTKGHWRKFKCRLTQMNISCYLITFKAILNSHIFPSCKCTWVWKFLWHVKLGAYHKVWNSLSIHCGALI